MKEKRGAIKRVLALQMDAWLTLLQTGIYAFGWFYRYYPLLRLPRFSKEGIYLGEGLKLYFNGHILVIAIYLFLLILFSRMYKGGNGSGYLRPLNMFFSQLFAIFIVNLVTYVQLALMRGWIVDVKPILLICFAQIVLTLAWSYLSDLVYTKVFPVRKMLLISGEYPADEIISKFMSRSDRYEITKSIGAEEGKRAVKQTDLSEYGGVVLWDIPASVRNDLLKTCYAKGIRVYVMPKISDVLLKGSVQMHLFDTPILMVQDYSMSFGQRFIKRCIDLVCAVLLMIVTSPIMLVTAVIIRAYDHGPVFYKQIRCTQHMKEFNMVKFRSMRVDAEKDGVARLAGKNDSRITPFGRFIRTCRIDELPQLMNVIKGDMSFIGPRPERPDIIKQYLEIMPEFSFRTRVKAGLAGYAQIYGKYNTTPYDKLKLDLTYIENYSVWLDLKLMLLTLKILFTPDSTEGVDDKQTTALKK